MDDWDLPDSVFLTGGRIRDTSGAESTSPAFVCVVVGMVGILMALVFLLSRSTRDEARPDDPEEDPRLGESLTVDEAGVTGFVDNEAIEHCYV